MCGNANEHDAKSARTEVVLMRVMVNVLQQYKRTNKIVDDNGAIPSN